VEADAAGLSRIVAHLSANFPTGSAVSAGFRERVLDVQAEYSGTLLHMLRLLASEAGQIEEQHRSALVWRHLPPRRAQASTVAGAFGAPLLPSASALSVSGVPVPHEFQRAHAGAIGGRLSAVHSRARMVSRSHRVFPRAPQRSVVTDTRVQLVAGTVARSASVHADPEADPFRGSGVEVFAGSRMDVSERECAAAGVSWALEVVRVPLFAALDAPAAAGHTLNAADAAAAALRVRAQDRRLPEQTEGAGEDGAVSGGATVVGDVRSGAEAGAGDASVGDLDVTGAVRPSRGATARGAVQLRGPVAVGDGIVDGVAVPAPSGAPSQPRAHASSLRRLHCEYGALSELILSPFFPDACGLHEAMDAPPAVTSIAGPATVFLYEAVPGAVPLSQLLAAGGGMVEAQPLFRHLASQVLQALCDVEAMCCYDVEEGGIGVENVYVSEAGARVTLRGVAWGEPLPSPLVPSPLLPGYGFSGLGAGAEGAWERLAARSARLRRCFARILRQMLVFASPAAGEPQLPGIACAAAVADAGASTEGGQTEGEGDGCDLGPLATHLPVRDSLTPAASAEADAAVASERTLLCGCQRLDGAPEPQRMRAFGRAQAEAGIVLARYEVFDLLLPLVPRVAPPSMAHGLSAATVQRVGDASRSSARTAAAGGFTSDSGLLGGGSGVSTSAAAVADGADYLFVSGGRATRRAEAPTAESEGSSNQLAAGEAVSAAVAQRWEWTLEQRLPPAEGATRGRLDGCSNVDRSSSVCLPPVRLTVLSAMNELLPTALLRNPSALGGVAAGSGAGAAAGAADGGGFGSAAATASIWGEAGAGGTRQGREGRPALMWATRITVRASGCGQASFWLRRARRHVGGGASAAGFDDLAAAADAYASKLLEAHAAAGGVDTSVMKGEEGAAGSRGGGGASPMAAGRKAPSGLVGAAGGSPPRRGFEGFRSVASVGGGEAAVDAEGREVAALLCSASVYPSARSATLRCVLELLQQPLQAEPAYVALRCLADAMPPEATGGGDEDAAEGASQSQPEIERFRMPGAEGASASSAASCGMSQRMARLVLRLAALYGLLPQHAAGASYAAGEADSGDVAAALRFLLDILHPRHLSAEALEGAALAHAPAGAAAAQATEAGLTQAAVAALLAPPRALSSLSELLAHPYFSDLTPALAAAEVLVAGDGAQGASANRSSAASALDGISFVLRLQRRRVHQLASGVSPLHVQLHLPAPGEDAEAERAETAAMQRIQEDFQAWYGRVL
jgi:hypothetical protein